jgi:hypothetical protein
VITDDRPPAVSEPRIEHMNPRDRTRERRRGLAARLTTAALAVLLALCATGCHFHITFHAGQQVGLPCDEQTLGSGGRLTAARQVPSGSVPASAVTSAAGLTDIQAHPSIEAFAVHEGPAVPVAVHLCQRLALSVPDRGSSNGYPKGTANNGQELFSA